MTSLSQLHLISPSLSLLLSPFSEHFYSSLYYMENFHWPPTDTDKLSYVLVTFHAAMEYIRGPEVEHLLPERPVFSVSVWVAGERKKGEGEKWMML